jgi:hypothetical protein
MNLFEKDESGVWCESQDGLYARKENKGVAPNCPRLGRRSCNGRGRLGVVLRRCLERCLVGDTP